MGGPPGGDPAPVPAGAVEDCDPNRLEPVPRVELVDSIDEPTEDVADVLEPPGKAGRVVGNIGVPLEEVVVVGRSKEALLEDDVVLVEEMLD